MCVSVRVTLELPILLNCEVMEEVKKKHEGREGVKNETAPGEVWERY